MVKLVLACSTAKEVWTRLKEVHSQNSETCKMLVQQEFYNIKMQPGAKVSSYVAEVELLAKKLRDIGVLLGDDELISKIVSGLTADFKNFMSTWLATSREDRKYSNSLPRLLAEETMRSKEESDSGVAMKASVTHANHRYNKHVNRFKKKQVLKCYVCGDEGHFKKDCPKARNRSNGSIGKKYAVVARSQSSDKQVWFFDSGSSFHMVKHREWFSNYKPHERKVPIQVGNCSFVYSLGKGSVDVTSIVDGKMIALVIKNVEYVPDIG